MCTQITSVQHIQINFTNLSLAAWAAKYLLQQLRRTSWVGALASGGLADAAGVATVRWGALPLTDPLALRSGAGGLLAVGFAATAVELPLAGGP